MIFLIAVALRMWRLDHLELFGDEVDAGFQAYSLLKTGRDFRGNFLPLYMHSLSEWRAPLLMYAMAPFVGIFGLNEWGVRLTAAFWGLADMAVFYWLLKEFKVKESVSLTALFLLAVLPWHIQYSRTAFELTLMAGLILLGLVFLKKKKDAWAAIFLGLSIYAYNTANVYVPFLTVLTVVMDEQRDKLKRVVKMGLLVGLVTAPMLWMIVSGHAGDRFRLVSVFSSKEIVGQINQFRNWDESRIVKLFYNRPSYWLVKILRNYGHALSTDFLFGEGDTTFRHSLHRVGNLYWAMLPMILLGLIKAKKRPDKFWLGFLAIAPAAAAVTIDGGYHASRLFLLIFPMVYFAAKGMVWLATKLPVMAIGLAMILVFEFLNFQVYYWRLYPLESWRWWHWGYKEIMTELKKQEGNFDKLLIENTYEPALIRYWFWTKSEPNKQLFEQDDKMRAGQVNGFDGFCFKKRICFVNFGNRFEPEMIEENKLYMISQDRNVAGVWDWQKSPPEGIEVLAAARNPLGEPLFYLVTKEKKGVSF